MFKSFLWSWWALKEDIYLINDHPLKAIKVYGQLYFLGRVHYNFISRKLLQDYLSANEFLKIDHVTLIPEVSKEIFLTPWSHINSLLFKVKHSCGSKDSKIYLWFSNQPVINCRLQNKNATFLILGLMLFYITKLWIVDHNGSLFKINMNMSYSTELQGLKV